MRLHAVQDVAQPFRAAIAGLKPCATYRKTTAALLLAVLAVPFIVRAQTRIDPSLYGGLKWRSIGPFRSGRVNGVSGVPG
jgi:hypothetical protein